MKFDWNTSTAKTNFIHHAMRKNNLEQPSKITFRMYVNMFDFVKKKNVFTSCNSEAHTHR